MTKVTELCSDEYLSDNSNQSLFSENLFIGSAIIYGQTDTVKLKGTFLQLFGVYVLQKCKIY
jgi:hypothetical protein